MDDRYLRKIVLEDAIAHDRTYIRDLPVVRSLRERDGLELCAPVTFLVGENGTGKSTLLEAVAVAHARRMPDCIGISGWCVALIVQKVDFSCEPRAFTTLQVRLTVYLICVRMLTAGDLCMNSRMERVFFGFAAKPFSRTWVLCAGRTGSCAVSVSSDDHAVCAARFDAAGRTVSHRDPFTDFDRTSRCADL